MFFSYFFKKKTRKVTINICVFYEFYGSLKPCIYFEKTKNNWFFSQNLFFSDQILIDKSYYFFSIFEILKDYVHCIFCYFLFFFEKIKMCYILSIQNSHKTFWCFHLFLGIYIPKLTFFSKFIFFMNRY